ncbi:MAG: hypothetical protein JNM39_18665 [Bdellovibrionaceae bacterium]|nr:hypothetical protein [Pseudobdellovibrionaceae bacterium]
MDFFWYVLSLIIVYHGTAESLKRHYEAKIEDVKIDTRVQVLDEMYEKFYKE